MHSKLVAAILAFVSTSLVASVPTADRDDPIVDEQFFETLENMMPRRSMNPFREGFTVESAIWNNEARILLVKSRTDREKGMFLSLMGLPASTWVDAFDFSADHVVEYTLPIAAGNAVPCQVVVRSAFDAQVVAVSGAPDGCSNPLQLTGQSVPNASVSAIVGGAEFTTFTDENGNYTLDLYSASPDAPVTITVQRDQGTRI